MEHVDGRGAAMDEEWSGDLDVELQVKPRVTGREMRMGNCWE